jgi:hypothetical protein
MIGIWTEQGAAYLGVLAIVTMLFFSLPLFFQPLSWARLMLWEVPEQTHLAIYFGRCLGAFILIIQVIMLRGALSVADRITAFEVLYLVFGLMWLIHVYGAIRRIQPLSETLEIGLWTVLLLLNTAFYPGTTLI